MLTHPVRGAYYDISMSMPSMGRGHRAPREGTSVVRNLVGDRRFAALAAAVAVCVAAVGAASPGTGMIGSRGPAQEGPSDEHASSDDAQVAIDVDVADGDAEAISGALDEINANVADQLNQLSKAEAVVMDRLRKLSSVDDQIRVTESRLESLTNASDSVIVTSFVNPPYESAVDAVTAQSVEGSTVKQAILQMRADKDARQLKKLQTQRSKLDTALKKQRKLQAEARRAKQDAEAAVDDLKAAFGQEAQFIAEINAWMNDPNGAARRSGLTPAQLRQLADAKAQLAGKIKEVQDASAAKQAAIALAAEQARARQGTFICPVQGPVSFIDSFGAPRSGGRRHKGQDIMAPRGRPTVAPASGRVVHDYNTLGGNTWKVYADNGDMYYGAHLSAYVGGDGHVAAGTVIGLVGNTGDASGGVTHLHFEFHPGGGGAVNMYNQLVKVCDRSG
jgi:murein DD-endopeptidase MepM/ murein hydrolase activator NlpD